MSIFKTKENEKDKLPTNEDFIESEQDDGLSDGNDGEGGGEFNGEGGGGEFDGDCGGEGGDGE